MCEGVAQFPLVKCILEKSKILFEGVCWAENFLAPLLPVEIKIGTILPLWLLHTDTAYENLQVPDESVGCTHKSDDNPNPDATTHTQVQLPPLVR